MSLVYNPKNCMASIYFPLLIIPAAFKILAKQLSNFIAQ